MLSPHIKGILEGLSAYKEDGMYSEDNGPSISVNKLTGKAGTFYEKVRYLVDYKEEHTIRRSAIERILKRKLLIGNNENIGLSFLQELVSSGYLPNKRIPEGISNDIKTIVNKYLLLGKMTGIGNSRVIGLMASETERFLYPQLINNIVADSFYATVSNHITYTKSVSQDDLNMQAYIGCRRSLLEDDQETLLYAVLVKYVPELPTLRNEDEIKNIAQKFLQAISSAEKVIEDPLGWKMSSKLRNYSIYFSIIKEIVKKYGVTSEAIFDDNSRLEEEIKKILSEKYSQQFNLVNKSGTRAVAYILLTKVILALVLELPYEKFVLSSIDYFALGTNIIFHPLLLLAMVKTIQPPSSNNINNIISGVKAVVQNENVKQIYIKPPISNIIIQIMYGLLYTVLFVISFGLILWILKSLHFNIVSMILFLFFLTFVSYFGFRIRHNSRKWMVSTENENILTLLWIFFTIPIVRTGRWLSKRFSSVNVFVFIMDFILETPFKFVLGTFDSFISFLKEKREDPY